MGNAVEDQQLGCLWQGTNLLSISLSGFINYLDVNNPSTPLRVVKVGTALLSPCLYTSILHFLAISGSEHKPQLTDLCLRHCVCWEYGRPDQYPFITVSVCSVCFVCFLDSIPCHWGVESGDVDLVSGQGHTNSVCCLQTTPELLLSLGLDKSLKSTALATNELM